MVVWHVTILNPDTGEEMLILESENVDALVEEINDTLRKKMYDQRINKKGIYSLSSPALRKQRASFVEKTEKWLIVKKINNYERDDSES